MTWATNAYGAVQLYSVFQREEELLDSVESALLRLFDLGLIRLVAATPEVGYRVDHNELPAIGRAELVANWSATGTRRTLTATRGFFYDPTPAGEGVLESVPVGQIPRVSGTVRRPWIE